MTDLRKAAEMALEALEELKKDVTGKDAPEHWDAHYAKQMHALDALDALRQALAQPANQSDCGHEEYKPLCQMCMATKQKPWDTSDMAHRAGGLSVDLGTDRGAWSDVPDATKWVDELRGDEEPEQEPVANIRIDRHGDAYIDLYVDLPTGEHEVYTAPPQREWVGLTTQDYHEFLKLGGFKAFKAIEAKLKEKNHD